MVFWEETEKITNIKYKIFEVVPHEDSLEIDFNNQLLLLILAIIIIILMNINNKVPIIKSN